MRAVFIVYNQAYNLEIPEALEAIGQKGYTLWRDIDGCGSSSGEPHLGNHAWPTMNNAVMTVVDDDKVKDILNFVQEKDIETPALGLRAFVWKIDSIY